MIEETQPKTARKNTGLQNQILLFENKVPKK